MSAVMGKAVSIVNRDQVSFDPEYATPPLSHFAPAVREVFSPGAG